MKRLPLPLFALLLLTGCHRSPGIVGKWHGTTDAQLLGTLDTDAEFKGDGSMTITVESGGKSMSTSGAYTLTGDTLRYTSSAGSLNGYPFPSVPAQSQTTETYRVTLSGDEMTLDRQGAPTRVVLKRVP